MKKYTEIWNQQFIKNTHGMGNFNLCLEIGCFEGLTSNYIVSNMLSNNGKLICVDPLTDFYLNENLSEEYLIANDTIWKYFNGQYDRFINNCKTHIENNKIELIRKLSTEAFLELKEKYKEKFDFIYIDGDHREEPVYRDSVMSFELCRAGGYILFDDYSWNPGINSNLPKTGIDKFLTEYSDKIEILTKGYQLLIKKI